MALIIPPGYGQAVYNITLAGDAEGMVVTCGHDLGDVGGDFQDAVDSLRNHFAEFICPVLDDQYTFVGVDLYVGQDPPPSLLFQSVGAPVPGSKSGAVIPPNSAYLVRKRTGLAGRRGRGRLYLPGVLEGGTSATGIISSGDLTVMQEAVDDWFNALLGGGTDPTILPPVILHRSEGAGVEPVPTPVTSFQVDSKIATQRRRLRP